MARDETAAARRELEGVGGELTSPDGRVPGILLIGVALRDCLALPVAQLVRLVADQVLALAVEPTRLGLDDAGGLLHGRALPELAGPCHHLVEPLPAGPGAEHVSDPNTRNEDQPAAHLASFPRRPVHPAPPHGLLGAFRRIWAVYGVPGTRWAETKPGGAEARPLLYALQASDPR